MLSFTEFGIDTGTILLLRKVDDSGFPSIYSLILHLCTIHENSGSSVALSSRAFPLFLGVPASFDAGKYLVILAFANALSKGAVTLKK